MAFLTINGWEIPVEEVTEEQEILGGATRTLGGDLIANQKYKRKWAVRTTIMHPNDALTLKAILTSVGDHWGFDNLAGISTYDRTINNFWVSDKGLAPTIGTSTFRPKEGPGGLNAVAVEKDGSNLLNDYKTASFEDNANPPSSGIGNWTISCGSNSSYSVTDEGAYHGIYSLRLKITGGSTLQIGVESPFISIGSLVPGTDYLTFSWYEKHNINMTSISGSGLYSPPAIIFYSGSPGNETEISRVELTNLGTASNNWHRHSITSLIPSGTTYFKVRYGMERSFSTYYKIYLDAIQVEGKSAPTSFMFVSRSNDSTVILPFKHYTEDSFSCVISFLIEIPTTSHYLFYVFTPSFLYSYTLQLYITQSILYFRCFPPSGDRLYILLNPYSTNVWYNVGISWNSSKVICYVNGSKVVDQSTGYKLWYDPDATIRFPATHFPRMMANALFMPISVSESFLASATSSNVYYKMPYVTISGEMVNNQTVFCLPTLEDTEYIYYSHAGVWTKGEKISFTLTEV